MIIMLVGKISRVDWRHAIVRSLPNALENLDPSNGWPILERSIHGVHDYSGPYYKNLTQEEKAEGKVAKTHRLCLEAIDASDLIYAWVDDPTCYASYFELGYAHAKGKYTVVAYPPKFDRSELWFTSCCVDLIIETPKPELGLLKAVLSMVRAGRIKSPTAELAKVEGNLARLEKMGLGSSVPTTMETVNADARRDSGSLPKDDPTR